MYKFYPYIKHQEDLVAVVESEYKIKTMATMPTIFIQKMLDCRRETILQAMDRGDTIKFDKLGKLKIPNSIKDIQDVKAYLGDNVTPSNIKAELKRRYNRGELLSQRYSKNVDKHRRKGRGKYFTFTVYESNDNDNID